MAKDTEIKGSKCEDCNGYMLEVDTCNKDIAIIDGKDYNRNRYDDDERCHDCGILNGNIHHFGCDMERCPKCYDQFAFCDCDKEIK